MPAPKRYFHCSQDLNSDPEVWEFTTTFGERSLRTLIQILVLLDKSGNRWRLSGDWLATLSRMVRQSVANVSRQIGWMTANGWLRVLEEAADGSPLVLEAPNWWKYNRRQEQKGDSSVPATGADQDPLLTIPTPSLTVPTPNKTHMPPAVEVEFEELWKLYPARHGKRVGKAEARKKFEKLARGDRQLVLVAARNYAKSQRVKDGIGIPDLHRWLRKDKDIEPWRDWLEPEQVTKGDLNEKVSLHAGFEGKDYRVGAF
ncbi:MAG: hypothetical protein LZF60_160140 [Nitrospira sp.]|nr:MAG: hypothetical protein LZF60_160140 [Nitrospira sp.]